MPENSNATYALIGGAIFGFCGAGLAMLLLLMKWFLFRSFGPNATSAPAIISYAVAGAAVILLIVFLVNRNLRDRFFLIGFLMGLCVAALLQGACFSNGS